MTGYVLLSCLRLYDWLLFLCFYRASRAKRPRLGSLVLQSVKGSPNVSQAATIYESALDY